MFDSLDDSQFKALGDAATSSRQYRLGLYAFEATHLIVLAGLSLYVVLYIRAYSPPLAHRAFLLFVLLVVFPLAFVHVRRVVHGWLFDRALKRQAIAQGLFSDGL